MKDPALPKAPRRQLRLALPLAATLGLSLATPSVAHAADPVKLPVVSYSADLNAFEQILPHRTPFIVELLRPSTEPKFDSVVATFWETSSSDCVPSAGAAAGKSCCKAPAGASTAAGGGGDIVDGKHKYQVQIPKLRYSTGYCFQFAFRRGFADADKVAIETAMIDTLKAGVKVGVYDQTLIHNTLLVSLGPTASVPAYLVAGAGGGPPTLKPLIALLEARFFSAGDFAKGASYEQAHRAWEAYHDENNNIHIRVQELVDLDLKEEGPFGKVPPPDVARLQSLFVAASAAAKEMKVDQPIPGAQLQELDQHEPAALEAKLIALRDQMAVLHDVASKVKAERCVAPAKLDAKQKNFCNSKVEGVINATDQLATRFKNMIAAQELYAGLKKSVVEKVKLDIDAFVVKVELAPLVTADLTYTERSSFYISADVGMAVPIFAGGGGVDVAPFLGINLYFTGVDKEVPLSVEDSFLKRFSVTGGITLNTIQDSKKTVEGIVNGNALLAGAGFRLTDYLRVGAGAVLLRQSDANPVATGTKHVRATPYLAVSIDVDVAGIVTDNLAKFKK